MILWSLVLKVSYAYGIGLYYILYHRVTETHGSIIGNKCIQMILLLHRKVWKTQTGSQSGSLMVHTYEHFVISSRTLDSFLRIRIFAFYEYFCKFSE